LGREQRALHQPREHPRALEPCRLGVGEVVGEHLLPPLPVVQRLRRVAQRLRVHRLSLRAAAAFATTWIISSLPSGGATSCAASGAPSTGSATRATPSGRAPARSRAASAPRSSRA